MTLFDEVEELPKRFFDIGLREIKQLFPHPTLLKLASPLAKPEAPVLFVSVLLHGNEDAGLLATQHLLRRYQQHALPRDLWLLIGNVDACAAGVRYLPNQVDFNRAWPIDAEHLAAGELPTDSPTPTHLMLEAVRQRVLERGVVASIDIHNNTGRNPIYGCVCSCAPEHVHLASQFCSTIVYFKRPLGVQTQAFMDHCPAMTCECGQIGDTAGAMAAANFLDTCLQQADFKPPANPTSAVQIYHTVARIKVREECSLGFEPGADVVLRDDLDLLNFIELDAGEPLGTLATRVEDCFVVNDEQGRDVTDMYLSAASQKVVLGCSVMPSMLTRNLDVIRKDCLGYLMEKLP